MANFRYRVIVLSKLMTIEWETNDISPQDIKRNIYQVSETDFAISDILIYDRYKKRRYKIKRKDIQNGDSELKLWGHTYC